MNSSYRQYVLKGVIALPLLTYLVWGLFAAVINILVTFTYLPIPANIDDYSFRYGGILALVISLIVVSVFSYKRERDKGSKSPIKNVVILIVAGLLSLAIIFGLMALVAYMAASGWSHSGG